MPYLPLTEDDARTFATRVLAFELTGEHRATYIETLICLLRDAYTQRNPAAVSFVRPFLDGLLPDSVIKAHEQQFSARLLGTLSVAEPEPAPQPNGNGGLKVESAVPPPTRPPAMAADRKPVQSSTLKW